jgi:hypothetical protein
VTVRPALAYYLGGEWTPRAIGSLVAWWDAEVPSSLTLSGSAVTAWRDVVGGAVVSQAFGAACPTYSATSYNGRPGLTFDGSDDALTYGAAVLLGAAVGEMWALVDQAALVGDTTARAAFTTGSSTSNKRELARVVASGANRARAATFDGTTTPTAQDTTVDFSGLHVIRAVFATTLLTIDIDGTTTSTVITGNNNSGTSRTRVGANANGTAGNFWNGVINSALVFNALLTADEANRVRTYFDRRRA